VPRLGRRSLSEGPQALIQLQILHLPIRREQNFARCIRNVLEWQMYFLHYRTFYERSCWMKLMAVTR
jgi:hypothetical protein